MMRAASMNILCHVMGDREILSLRWGALHGDTRNALISTPLVVESSPRAFWKARSLWFLSFKYYACKLNHIEMVASFLFFFNTPNIWIKH